MGILGVILYILAWICGFISDYTGNQILPYAVAGYLFLFSVGFYSLCFFLAHTFYAETIAESWKWLHSPFQYEVGILHLALVVLGAYSFFDQGFWTATLIVYTITRFGNALVRLFICHRRNTLTMKDLGIHFYLNIIVPITLIVLLGVV